MPDGTKPLPEQVLTWPSTCSLVFIRYIYLNTQHINPQDIVVFEICTSELKVTSPRGQWVKFSISMPWCVYCEYYEENCPCLLLYVRHLLYVTNVVTKHVTMTPGVEFPWSVDNAQCRLNFLRPGQNANQSVVSWSKFFRYSLKINSDLFLESTFMIIKSIFVQIMDWVFIKTQDIAWNKIEKDLLCHITFSGHS